MNFEEDAKKMLLLTMVQKMIFCPVTNEVLDIDTCGYFVDGDGWPAYVLSPAAFAAVSKSQPILDSLAAKGLHLPA